MNEDVEKNWEQLLNPEILRTNLIAGSIFISVYEMLEDSIIGRVKDFFTDGFDQKGWIINKRYQSEVLVLNKKPLYASMEWLKRHDVIDDNDIQRFNSIRDCRNEIVHEMGKYLSMKMKIDPLPLFGQMIELLSKIEKWWIVNVELPTNPDYDNQEIDETEILPGKLMFVRLLADIALGPERESKQYYNEFFKRKRSAEDKKKSDN